MSRIYFHSEHGGAAVRGSERAYAQSLIDNLALAGLRKIGEKTRLELRPDTWSSFYFADRLTAFDLMRIIQEESDARDGDQRGRDPGSAERAGN